MVGIFGTLLSPLSASFSVLTPSAVGEIAFTSLFSAPTKARCHRGHAREGSSCLLCI